MAALIEGAIFSKVGVFSSFGGMLLIGALEALYGPSLIELIEKFSASRGLIGLIVSAHFAAGLIGVLASQRVHKQIGNRRLVGAGYVLLVSGSLGFAWAPTIDSAILASAVAGLGFGALDYSLSHLFAIDFGTSSAQMLNILHGFFGLGAIAAPLVVALTSPSNYAVYFTGFAVLALLFAFGVIGISPTPVEGNRSSQTDGAGTQSGDGPVPTKMGLALIAMICIFVFHVAVGSGVGAWEAPYLAGVGLTVEQAALATSAFWLSMTSSRFILSGVMKRLSPGIVVVASSVLMAVGAVTILFPFGTVIGFLLLGFAIGPIFPTALAWATDLFGGKSWVNGFLIAVSMIGGVVFPPLLGLSITPNGGGLFPLGLAMLSLVCVLACLPLLRRKERSSVPTIPPEQADAEVDRSDPK